MNCWVRRPGALRVETLDGKLLASTTKINESQDSLFISGSRKPWLLTPALVNPVKDNDGFVVRRPEARYGEPAYGTGRSAAALDPVELAGERPVPLEAPFANVAEIADIAPLSHHGRTATDPSSPMRPCSSLAAPPCALTWRLVFVLPPSPSMGPQPVLDTGSDCTALTNTCSMTSLKKSAWV